MLLEIASLTCTCACTQVQVSEAMTLDYFVFFINDLTIFPIRMYPFCHSLHGLFKINMIVPNHCTTDDGFLPLILQIHLCGRDVELAAQTSDQRLDASALF